MHILFGAADKMKPIKKPTIILHGHIATKDKDLYVVQIFVHLPKVIFPLIF